MKKALTSIIDELIKGRGRISSKELAKEAGISRQAAHKKLSHLVEKETLARIGTTRGAYYVPRKKAKSAFAKDVIELTLRNKGLEEHRVLEKIEKEHPLLKRVNDNAQHIFGYAFTEMLNNAIDHSRSKKIKVLVFGENRYIGFAVIDRGIGVYNNLMRKYKVASELEAVQELLKGKRTTMPKKHSGEGIFFTEKASDRFELEGGSTRLIIDNLADDVAVQEIPKIRGTKVVFKIKKDSKKSLTRIFNEYTDEEYRFSRTKVTIKLYEKGVDYVSRSQARRVLYGLDKFSTIILDFKGIKGIGQGFADEILRVYAKEHPHIDIMPVKASPAVLFMIRRVTD